MRHVEIGVFGEVLFDHFDDDVRVLGGAPFNVAWHLQAFARQPCLVSRVGDDADGRAILAAMREWAMDTGGMQVDPALPSGRVSVTLDQGQPSYEIAHPCAYDAIEAPGLSADGVLYHGSLALRDTRSRAAFEALRRVSTARVFFDVNLREPWWRRDDLQAWLAGADWVKLNQDELDLLGPSDGTGDGAMRSMLEHFDLQGLIVTLGEQGAVLLTRDGAAIQRRPEVNTLVVDTVGAGDAFAAVVILGLVQAWAPEDTLDRAQSFAAAVVAQQGATTRDRGFYAAFAQRWRP